MPLHPEFFEFLRQARELKLPPFREIGVSGVRALFRNFQPERPNLQVGRVLNLSVPNEDHSLLIRVYQPNSDTSKKPVVIMYHGGGWVAGDLGTVDGQCREVCRGSNTVVVAVDYRLAPEYRFPTAVNDSYAALEWVATNIEAYGGNPNQIVVAGDSAGGTLATVVSQMSHDQNGPSILGQILCYPVIDGTRFDRRSYLENAEGFGLTADDMCWYWELYAEPTDRLTRYASPLLADSLAGLPQTLVLTAEYDVLRDEGEEYAQCLKQARVPTELMRFDGFAHGFFSLTSKLPETAVAMQKVCSVLNNWFKSHTGPDCTTNW